MKPTMQSWTWAPSSCVSPAWWEKAPMKIREVRWILEGRPWSRTKARFKRKSMSQTLTSITPQLRFSSWFLKPKQVPSSFHRFAMRTSAEFDHANFQFFYLTSLVIIFWALLRSRPLFFLSFSIGKCQEDFQVTEIEFLIRNCNIYS